MASLKGSKKFFQAYPALKHGVEQVKRDVFGELPQLNVRTGHKKAKVALSGVYLNQYYLDPIDKFARKVGYYICWR